MWLYQHQRSGNPRLPCSRGLRPQPLISSRTAEDFDRLARLVEWWDPDDLGQGASPEERSLLKSTVGESNSADLGGLEMGVAGLAYALASAGMVPAASCRAHTGDRPWSYSPVVLFAADECHARQLEPLVRNAGCVFAVDAGRGHLLVVSASSVRNLMELADALARISTQLVRGKGLR